MDYLLSCVNNTNRHLHMCLNNTNRRMTFVSQHQCYGLDDYHDDPIHTWSMKQGCLVSFSIKRLYTRPNVVEIFVYHKSHTRVNGSPTHGQHEPRSIIHMSFYALQMSQALKDHIWIYLSLGYIVKQIYDKHKSICWQCVNVGEAMTRDDFIRHQDIAYLDRKHKKKSWQLKKKPCHFHLILGFPTSKGCFLFPRR